jgi:hypothetical protein
VQKPPPKGRAVIGTPTQKPDAASTASWRWKGAGRALERRPPWFRYALLLEINPAPPLARKSGDHPRDHERATGASQIIIHIPLSPPAQFTTPITPNSIDKTAPRLHGG